MQFVSVKVLVHYCRDSGGTLLSGYCGERRADYNIGCKVAVLVDAGDPVVVGGAGLKSLVIHVGLHSVVAGIVDACNVILDVLGHISRHVVLVGQIILFGNQVVDVGYVLIGRGYLHVRALCRDVGEFKIECAVLWIGFRRQGSVIKPEYLCGGHYVVVSARDSEYQYHVSCAGQVHVLIGVFADPACGVEGDDESVLGQDRVHNLFVGEGLIFGHGTYAVIV